jgi:hypothetical protein
MSDFLSKLVERSVSGSSAVRPQLEPIYNFPTENSGRFFAAEEQCEVTTVVPPHDTGSARFSRLETMRQPALQARAEIASASASVAPASLQRAPVATTSRERAPVAPASFQPAPSAQSTEQQVTSEHHTETRPPERDAPGSSRIEPADESSPQSFVTEVRAQKVIELIRRESPRPLDRDKPREFRAISQSPPPFRTATPRSEAREDLAASSINVTIGRVEVRATVPAPSSPARLPARAPITSLDDYLRKRAGGNPA